jgi:hypothetical protein
MIDAALLLPKILERARNNRELSQAAAIIAWKRVAGEGLARHTKPTMLRHTTLTVEVADEVWKKQLLRMSPELISRMNKLMKRELVAAIDFRINPALGRPTANASRKDGHKSLPDTVISSAAGIDDPELRERFMRAAANCIDRREVVKPSKSVAVANRKSQI